MVLGRDGWNERYAASDLVFTADPARFLGPEVGHLPPGRALDLGCGEGRNSLWLAERGWRATGVDFSEVGVARARRLGRERGLTVDWVVADVRRFEPPRATFDLVLQMFVHFPPPERREILGRAATALRPGGVLLVVGYHPDHVALGLGGGPRDPALLFTPDDLVGDLAGLLIERADRIEVVVDDDIPGHQAAVDTIVRASRAGGPDSDG